MVSQKAPNARRAKTEERGALIGAPQRRSCSATPQMAFLRNHQFSVKEEGK